MDAYDKLELLSRLWVSYKDKIEPNDPELYRDIVRDIEKNIPLTPSNFERDIDGNWAKCPVCGSNVNDWSSCVKCHTCGQALDWTEVSK